MSKPLPAAVCGILLFLAWHPLAGVAQQPGRADEPRLDRLTPHWEVGDRWTVETISRPLNVRADADQTAQPPPLRWQFNLAASDESDVHECFRVEVACQAEGQEIPKTVFWLDRNSFALRRITTYLPVPSGYEEMTMSYESASDQPAPILGPLSALPIDTPVLYSGAKGLQTFAYTSYFGRSENKELGDVGFAYQVEQNVTEISPDEVRSLFSERFAKSLTDDAFAKSLTSRPVTEVRLKSQGRAVRQLWQSKRPWPIYCDNGYTVSRLVAVERGEDRP